MRNVVLFAFAVLLGGAMMFGGLKYLDLGISPQVVSSASETPVHYTVNSDTRYGLSEAHDFTLAAEHSLPAVVHIRSSIRVDNSASAQPFDYRMLPDPFRDFFGNPQERSPQRERPMRQGSGSGVVISSDGYIVTNNHVIDDATEIEVVLNDKRSYEAKVIGVDPSTDIALIKIKESDLPYLQFANSDEVRVGEWAVAVGNPFNLSSTVTAGIVSAKSRNINIMRDRDRAPIESFIQTDAAVNPGNSGGALVNLNGDLIGINTAIASPTGAYSGYAFAVPSNIVHKVVTDLKEYGVVQRGFIGALIRDVNHALAEEYDLNVSNGVYVDSLTAGSAAAEAGIEAGDIIVKVDDVETLGSSTLLEMIGRHRPGDQVPITVVRDGREREVVVTLKNRAGNTDVVTLEKDPAAVSMLGASFADLTDEEREALDVRGGAKVVELRHGKLQYETNIREGFVITKVNREPVKSVDHLNEILENEEGGIMIEGKYPGDDETHYYAFGLQ